MKKLRELTEKEIATLVVYGCSAENWKNISVSENFSPKFFQNVHFSGKVSLGEYNEVFELPGGVIKHSGIFNCHIHNSEIGDNVFIDKIHNYIANCKIQENVYIENVNLICTDGFSTFGNGTEVATMIESGGREVKIFDKLSAPLAYIYTFYRHDKELVSAIDKLISEYAKSKTSDKGIIEKNAQIVNCGEIKNTNIGAYAQLSSVTSLSNGTIVSNEIAPVIIGHGVQCEDFIIQSGSKITEGALLTRSFVGQGCLIGKQFSAIDSLLFANFQGLHGEAVSIFAGPYTVTHHKSTLMLTAYYSFMNAGSGTNFSNHMYKLGPVHQGITERGVKTSSGSYIMWPAHIGAYSVVLGKHKGNPDLKDLPFSYLIKNEGESQLLPGINLHSAGTIRDVEKWPKRDLRKGEKIDPIIFDFLSPHIISKAIRGIEVLKDLLQKMEATATFVWYQNCKIKRSNLRKGIELYEMAVDSYLANTINKIDKTIEIDETEWVDLAGLIAPKTEIEKLCESIKSLNTSLPDIQDKFVELYNSYDKFNFSYANSVIMQKYGKNISELSGVEKTTIFEKGKNADKIFNDIILRDARKEFSNTSKIGFGLDGEEFEKNADFENVRGNFESHPFVIERLNRN